MTDQAAAAATGPRRPWHRLHWLSWLVLAAFAAALAIIAVPGMPSAAGPEFRPPSPDLPMPAPFTLVQTWEHGWPWPYLSRGIPYSWSFVAPTPGAGVFDYDLPADRTVLLHGVKLADEPMAWTTSAAWDFAGGEDRRVSLLAAGGDLVVCLAAIALAVALVEWRLRRRGGVLRWTLADLLIACTLLTCGIGWARYHQSRHESHAKVQELFEKFNRGWQSPVGLVSSFLSSLRYRRGTAPLAWDSQLDVEPTLKSRFYRPQWKAWRFDGPEWLARLVGSREALGWCWRLTLVDRGPGYWTFGSGNSSLLGASDDLSDIAIASPACLIEDLQPLASVNALHRLTLCITATEDEVRRFASEELGGRVTIDPASRFAEADTVALRRLRRRLDREGPEPRNADPRYLSLAPLTMTDELMRTYAPFLTEYVRQLTFGPSTMTREGWRIVGKCGNLENLDTGDANLSGRELAELRPLLLRELTLRQGDLTVDDLATLAEMKSLVTLTVRGAAYSRAEQAELRALLPAIEIDFEATPASK